MGSLSMMLALLALYIGDVSVFELRVRRGTAYGVIDVNQFLATPLKGQREEYDVVGTIQVTCARTIFPRPSVPACWWLERHKAEWQ